MTDIRLLDAWRETVTGCATDYFSDVAMSEFSWAIELPPFGRGSGGTGFLLPPEDILPIATENVSVALDVSQHGVHAKTVYELTIC